MELPHSSSKWRVCWTGEEYIELRDIVRVRRVYREEVVWWKRLVMQCAMIGSQAAQATRVLYFVSPLLQYLVAERFLPLCSMILLTRFVSHEYSAQNMPNIFFQKQS